MLIQRLEIIKKELKYLYLPSSPVSRYISSAVWRCYHRQREWRKHRLHSSFSSSSSSIQESSNSASRNLASNIHTFGAIQPCGLFLAKLLVRVWPSGTPLARSLLKPFTVWTLLPFPTFPLSGGDRIMISKRVQVLPLGGWGGGGGGHGVSASSSRLAQTSAWQDLLRCFFLRFAWQKTLFGPQLRRFL